MEKNTLIVYYSNSGTAGKIAQHIKKLLPEADTDRIGYKGKIEKRYGMLHALFKMFSVPGKIEGDAHDPSEYKKIILVFPIWAGMPAPVMRAYIKKHIHAVREKKYNMVCVSAGGEDKIEEWLEGRAVKLPAVKLSLKQSNIKADDYNLTGII